MKFLHLILLIITALFIIGAGSLFFVDTKNNDTFTKPGTVSFSFRDFEQLFIKEYIPLGGGIYMYGDSGYLLYRPVEKIDFTNYERFIDKYNSIIEVTHDVDFFAYYIPTSGAVDFTRLPIHDNYYDYIHRHLKVKQFERLDMNNFADYRNYFYKTDHHWNYMGSYQGYMDILKMLKPDAKVMEPVNLNCFDNLQSLGSNARLSGTSLTENFCAYEFEMDPLITVTINGEEGSYGNETAYKYHEYKTDLGVSHYGLYYGGDDGNLVFNNANKEGRLLVLGTSFDNAVVKLLAHEFNQVHVVDVRYYEEDMGIPFDLTAYVNENNINQVLLIGDNWFYKLNGE